MVKVQLKGGIWKNSEDEILKAAVQKYGKQQWARVASLLNRKTAKQAKARWYEWLDPSIKKTEWTRAEDEKLLHLAKLLPAQWKTIAPLVGRTATQCQEHYEELLDQAATGSTAESGGSRQQQQLRPGQIDSHPETKPARPDPIDMDEDEMEMLQEARARLANTQGKKAKRKQREKMLAEAKRLADLQKRRELKQAGLVTSQRNHKRRRKEIDLGVEIPFYKPAAAGFHDTTDEAARSEAMRQKRLKAVNLHKVNENLYRTRDKAAAAAEKREKARLKVLEQTNAKYEQQAKKLEGTNDSSQRRSRGLLQLPAPTVTDGEWSDLAKAQGQERSLLAAAAAGTSGVTQALLGDYTDRPLPTPMRTPATARRNLVEEASQLRKISQAQTPLLTATSATDDDDDDQMDTSDRKMAATPGRPDRQGVGATPASRRDELGLNQQHASDAASVGGSTFATGQLSMRELARQERRARKKARLELESALAALPAPLYDYDLAVPEDEPEDEAGAAAVTTVLDQADVEAAERERERLEREQKFRERSTVLQRTDLPRPRHLEINVDDDDTDEARRLVAEETLLLLRHDAYAFPFETDLKSSSKKRKKDAASQPKPAPVEPVQLQRIPLQELDQARSLVERETETLMETRIGALMGTGKFKHRSEAEAALVSATVPLPTTGTFQHRTVATSSPVLAREFDQLQDATIALKKKNDKVASKLVLVQGGYQKRAVSLSQAALEAFGQLQNARIEESVYTMLDGLETTGADQRVDRLTQQIRVLQEREATLQRRYGDLIVARRRRLAVSKG